MANTRYINVTTIDNEGTPTFSGIRVETVSQAYDYLQEKIRRGLALNQTWEKPVIAAFIFDTEDQTLTQFAVKGEKYQIVRLKG